MALGSTVVIPCFSACDGLLPRLFALNAARGPLNMHKKAYNKYVFSKPDKGEENKILARSSTGPRIRPSNSLFTIYSVPSGYKNDGNSFALILISPFWTFCIKVLAKKNT
jgi:hypothetical protein